jgi:hypothetical protein
VRVQTHRCCMDRICLARFEESGLFYLHLLIYQERCNCIKYIVMYFEKHVSEVVFTSLGPWYVSKLTLHRDLQIPFVTEEIKKYSTIYHSRLIRHENNQVTELSNPPHVKRRLRRQWPLDLIVEREEEEYRRTAA